MNKEIIGYIRVSSDEQNPQRQLADVETNKLFIDYVSGKDTNRPALTEMKQYARCGDEIIVHSMDRLARNLDDLRAIVKFFTQKQVSIKFVKEGLTFIGEDTPMSHLLLSVMGAFAEFERSLIRERQAEGIKIAKAQGKYKGRTKILNDEQLKQMHIQIANGKPKAKIAKEMGISRYTIYNYLKAIL